MTREQKREIDLVALASLASRPPAMMALVLKDPAPICDLLGIDRSNVTSKRQMRAMIKRELRAMRLAASTETVRLKFDEVEEAVPGPMTDQELANVLRGGTRRSRPR